MKKDEYLCENAGFLVQPNVTQQLDNIQLKVMTVPPLTVTINSLCLLLLDLPSSKPFLKLLLSEINNPHFSAKESLSTHCNWFTCATNSYDDETQLFDSFADYKSRRFLLYFILALTFNWSLTKAFKFSLIIEKTYKAVSKAFFKASLKFWISLEGT